jgi:hypothetical protein
VQPSSSSLVATHHPQLHLQLLRYLKAIAIEPDYMLESNPDGPAFLTDDVWTNYYQVFAAVISAATLMDKAIIGQYLIYPEIEPKPVN